MLRRLDAINRTSGEIIGGQLATRPSSSPSRGCRSPCSPPVVAVTSLHPDHLDWHGGVEQYYRDKLSACSQPGAELTVANGDSGLLREHAALLGPRIEWVSEHDDPAADWMGPLGLPGGHNRRNALIARRCLVALGDMEGAPVPLAEARELLRRRADAERRRDHAGSNSGRT